MKAIIGADDGQVIDLPGARLVIKVAACDSEGRYAVIETRNAPGWEGELHRHTLDSKTFYVLSGSYEVFVEGCWATATSGDTLLIRAGQAHGFRAGPAGGHSLVIYPGRAETWFADAARLVGPQPPRHPHNDYVESLGPLPGRPF